VHLILNVEVSERGAGVIALQLVETNLQGAHVLCARRPSLGGLEQLVAELGVVPDPRLDLLDQAKIPAMVHLLGASTRVELALLLLLDWELPLLREHERVVQMAL
jgi:hypothetical protein